MYKITATNRAGKEILNDGGQTREQVKRVIERIKCDSNYNHNWRLPPKGKQSLIVGCFDVITITRL